MYYEKVSKMEKEFNYNQKFTYKQLTPKSRINSLLLIDELKNYPDSYSILYSDVLVRFNDKDFEKKIFNPVCNPVGVQWGVVFFVPF